MGGSPDGVINTGVVGYQPPLRVPRLSHHSISGMHGRKKRRFWRHIANEVFRVDHPGYPFVDNPHIIATERKRYINGGG